MCVWECGLRPNKLLFNREDDDDELWDFWVPCCTGKLISHDNGLMASMVGTLRIPWVMALVEDDPSTYDGSSALLHLECTIASHVFLCAFFFIYVTYVCWLHSCVQSCWLHPRCIVGSGHLILLLRLVCVVVFACQTLTFSWLKLKSQFLLVVQSSHVHIDFICCGETVDGRNPALVGHYW